MTGASNDDLVAWFSDSVLVDGEGKPLIVYHGTADETFTDFQGERLWFADDRDDAEQYRRVAVLRQHEVDLPDGVYELNDLGDQGVRQVASEEGIEIEGVGWVISAHLRIRTLFDADCLTGGDPNVFDIAEAWERFQQHGIVDESWETLDETVQWELREDFEGKSWWKLLEENNAYDWIREQGFDGVRITDVNMSGQVHTAYMVLDASQIRIVDSLSSQEAVGAFRARVRDECQGEGAGHSVEGRLQ